MTTHLKDLNPEDRRILLRLRKLADERSRICLKITPARRGRYGIEAPVAEAEDWDELLDTLDE
jgi:hypothetical protein